MQTSDEVEIKNYPDAYVPSRVADLVSQSGVCKAHLSFIQTIVLAMLAGAFIAFGAMYYTLIISDAELSFVGAKLLGGVVFSLGLILVIVAGAELFTGNNLIVMAWAHKKVTTLELLRNWLIVYFGNFVGAMGCVLLVMFSGLAQENNWDSTAINIAQTKTTIGIAELFIRGVLCNILVCLAVWLCMAAHDVASKVLAIVFPISAFVALGFEHSIANMYFIPLGMLLESGEINIASLLHNLIPVTIGNIVGGSILVAMVYWIIYLRNTETLSN